MRPQKFGIILSLLLFPTLLHSQAPAINPTTPPTVTPIYLDPSAPLEQRVNDLVSRMTLEEKVSQMQDVAPAIPRLQIPAYNWWNEGLHGVARAGIATVFPQAIGLAPPGTPASSIPSPTSSPPKPAPNIMTPSPITTLAAITVSRSGRPTSTSSAILVGDAARKPTAKIPSSPPASA